MGFFEHKDSPLLHALLGCILVAYSKDCIFSVFRMPQIGQMDIALIISLIVSDSLVSNKSRKIGLDHQLA